MEVNNHIFNIGVSALGKKNVTKTCIEYSWALCWLCFFQHMIDNSDLWFVK